MRPLLLLLAGLALVPPAHAQRRFRLGPTASVIALDQGGSTESFTSLGGTVALLTGQDAETGITISRYPDLATGACERSLTFFGLDQLYYPVGADGLAPFASTQLGLARVTDQDVGLLGVCTAAEPSNELGLGFGLGLRLNLGGEVAGIVEGRFFQVPHSAIQALEGRANLSVAFGRPREGNLLRGTLGPAVGVWIPVSGPLRGRGPLLGVRFRRDTRTSGTAGLQLDYAPLTITEGCSAECDPYAILFAPDYEASLHPRWGRVYGALGFLLAGFPARGPDRGVARGLHGGLGADVYAGERVMINLNARLVWFQRNTGENVFGVQVGASLSPKLVPPSAAP
ncbi:MAG TPA: hypothetical protein VNI61_09840 [Gemmatimonadales bacterium]|nr:hypothetical protein [Gemmatimonadales bacterium]